MNLKKTLSAALALALLCPAAAVRADGLPAAEEAAETSAQTQAAVAAADLSMDAAAAILVDAGTGTVLYERNADAPRAIASITKVMTMLLVMEALDAGKITLEDKVTASEHAYSMGGSQIWLEPGEVMTVDELLRAVAVASANDAAVALAEYVGGSEEAFVADMNRKAAELGMTKTTFKNANGLDEEGHLSCARDVSVMSRALLAHGRIRDYITIWTDALRGGETQLTNTNKMLRTYDGMTGVKTGTTGNAGVCISASAARGGMELIAVVLGSGDSAGRFAAARTMLNYGFANYESAPIGVADGSFRPVRVKRGAQPYCEYSVNLPESVVVARGKAESVRCAVELAESVEAPVEAGQTVGAVRVFCGDEEIGSYPVTAVRAIEKIDFATGFRLLFEALLDM
ncbi:MAG: D-alanyl-D-alanine carboxypeptidase family protein [Oscillospiraceae bacterium]|nr:D-alanyl-D-alanine carboxypeptidase family protein [Oscillospiraceae bacterium]